MIPTEKRFLSCSFSPVRIQVMEEEDETRMHICMNCSSQIQKYTMRFTSYFYHPFNIKINTSGYSFIFAT